MSSAIFADRGRKIMKIQMPMLSNTHAAIGKPVTCTVRSILFKAVTSIEYCSGLRKPNTFNSENKTGKQHKKRKS